MVYFLQTAKTTSAANDMGRNHYVGPFCTATTPGQDALVIDALSETSTKVAELVDDCATHASSDPSRDVFTFFNEQDADFSFRVYILRFRGACFCVLLLPIVPTPDAARDEEMPTIASSKAVIAAVSAAARVNALLSLLTSLFTPTPDSIST